MATNESNPASRCPVLNYDVGSPNLCTGSVEYENYNYNVHLWTAALFVALFATTLAIHIVQAILSRRWWLFGTIIIGAISETLGWSARLWSALGTRWTPILGGVWRSPGTAFLVQISTLIFAPAFLAAFWYILLGQLIQLLGPQYCRFNPKTYAIIFVCGDVVSLVVQAVGGGIASAANTLDGANQGAYIMVGGVIAQMVVMVLYSILLVEVVLRYVKKRPVKAFRFRKTRPVTAVPEGSIDARDVKKCNRLIAAMVFSTTLIFIRSIYRTIELLDGWNGPIISREDLFCVLDGLMVFLAIAIFNIAHPLWLLPKHNAAQPTFQEEKRAEVVDGQEVPRQSV